MIFSTFFDNLDSNKIILLAILFASFLACILLLCIIKISTKKRTPFNKVFKYYKQIEMSIVINLNEKIVEKYYVYDQFHKSEILSLDEFYLRICDYNICKRLDFWLENIKDNNYTSRLELAMYDENNNRRIYKAELERFDRENNTYYLFLKDTTESPEVIKRVNKIGNNTNIDAFYEKANIILANRNIDEKYYLVAIKYKEFNDIRKLVKSSEYLSLLDALIYTRLNNRKNPNDLLCQSNEGVILLFTHSLMNEKKTKRAIKKLINQEASGTYIISKSRYSINLVAGISAIKSGETLTGEKKIEAEEAANSLIKHYMSSEKIRFYDTTLVNKRNEELTLKARVQKIVEDMDFDFKYTKLFKVTDKKQDGFLVDFSLKAKDHLTKDEFINICREIGSRKLLYSKIFNEMLSHNLYSNNTYYISLNYQDIDKVMEAYSSNEEFKKLNIYFCISYNNISKRSYNDISEVEKQIHLYKKSLKVHFGINYNSLQTIYLNENLYNLMEIVLFSGNLVANSLDTYGNGSLIDMYVKVAKKYKHFMIASDVSSLAIYEFFYKQGVNEIGGKVFTTKIDSNEIVDKLLLLKLNAIENKTY